MTQAADALPTNLFPTPDTFSDFSVHDLLLAASHGRTGVDQRLVRSIMNRDDREGTIGDLVRFANIAGDQPLDLRADLIEIFRRFKTTEAIPFYLDIMREYGDDYPDELIEAVVEQGAAMIEPLLALYEELGEEQGSPAAFLLAGLQVLDGRILKLLLEEFEYDTWEGAFHLGMYGDPAAKPAIEKRLSEPGLDEEMQLHLKNTLAEIDEGEARRAIVIEPPDIYELFDEKAGPDFDVLPSEDVAELLHSTDASYRSEALESLAPDDVEQPAIEKRVRELAESDPDPSVRGRAWEALASRVEEDENLLASMKAVANDASRAASERSGAIVALATATDGSEELTNAIKEMYAEESERKHILKAMWRSMDRSFASYMQFHLDDPDPEVCEQAIFGAGYLGITSEANRLEKFFENERLRSPALFNYAMIVPGPKDRMGVKSILTKIEKVAKGLNSDEREIVKVALDRRLEMKGMKPVFHEEHYHDEDEEDE
jgi:hypothetical protein